MKSDSILPIVPAWPPRMPRAMARLLLAPAACDWIVITYLGTVLFGLGRAPASAARTGSLALTLGVLGSFLAVIYAYRLRFERGADHYLVRTVYRLAPLAALVGMYLNLRTILPVLNPGFLDEQLYQIDLALFGVEPTVWVERFSSPRVVEWFACFYYSYFYFVACFVFVIALTETDEKRLAYFAIGAATVIATGHFVYSLVPGLGPYAHLSHEYQGPLRGGVFYHLVLCAVSADGAMKDIFPSIHTAMPTFITLFAWRHYRRVAPLATVVAVNIIGATLVLRWHYAIDVLAGLTLATVAFLATPRLVERYQALRVACGQGEMRRW
jgi:hypothetical protein